MDFTLEKYKKLLEAVKKSGIVYHLRHDVDLYPERSLEIAKVEAKEGMTATYYFRAMHFDSHAETIKAIVALGHRAGYHYECLTTCNGDMEAAYKDFCKNLDRLRRIVPVSTACAHGSPRSPWNSQDIWEEKSRKGEEGKSQRVEKSKSRKGEVSKSRYDIHSLGIEYEPMMDTDFSKTLYLTDTGRRWDGYKVSVRDKVPQHQEQWIKEGLEFHSSDDIIRALKDPSHAIHRHSLLINTHPQRWMPFGTNWLIEAAVQNIKNIAKRILISCRY